MRQTRQIMGMPVTIDVPNCGSISVFREAFTRFNEVDAKFSTYKKDSEVSKLRRGELQKTQLSGELKFVIKECHAAEKMTDGYFSAWAAGTFDPSGYVKGWAIAEAAKIIEKNGYKTYCIGAGGDILASSDSGRVWDIGIQDPADKTKILDKLSILNGAVATSGNYERGNHIINPKTGRPATEFLSVTVTGPDIITADILATAVYAAGSTELMKKFKDYQSYVIKPSHSRGSSL